MGRRVERAGVSISCSGRASGALEFVFFFFLAVLSVSFVGSAVWVGFDPAEVARGLLRMEMPGRHGAYDPRTSRWR